MQNLKKILQDLKYNADIAGLKVEYETEGAGLQDVLKLKKLADEFSLTFEIKIGGCGAVRDLKECLDIKPEIIVAPMIESSYALKKFTDSVYSVYKNNLLPHLYINLETITGINNSKEIINSKEFEKIDGIILGRGDLAASMNLTDVSDIKIMEIIKSLYEKTKLYNKKFIIGGKIKPEEVDIISQYTDFIETRKIIFGKKVSRSSIQKAIEFEIYWLQNKRNKTHIDSLRINELTERLK